MTLLNNGTHPWTLVIAGSAVITLRLDAGHVHKTQQLEGEEQSGLSVERNMAEPLIDGP